MLLRLVSAFVFGTLALTATADDHAHHMMGGAPAATQVWSRAMPPSAPTGAVYFVLNNPGDQPDRLISAQTPRAEKVEFHRHVHKGDVMRMERMDFVEIPAHGAVTFEPGGNHVMLFGLSQPLVAGEHFPLTLNFEKAGEVAVEVPIQDQAPETDAHAHMHQ